MSIPAAQYLRMSTEGQEFSIANQEAAIADYCGAHGFAIVESYVDPGRSGVILRNRPGLQRLLADVVAGPAYKAILVYDVSRWGRFQDVDESAHYEYVCRSAGIPVHYCAEAFGPENTTTNLLMKSVKRLMAAEYSRELGEKALRGLRCYAEMGIHVGATPPYGFRRMLLGIDGQPKQLLKPGEGKSLRREHVTLVLGPKEEVETVQQIFQWKAKENLSLTEIASGLNRRKIPFPNGDRGPLGKWTTYNVRHVLTDLKYTGSNVWGVTTQRLKTYHTRLPKEQWVIKEGAFPAIVSNELFEEAAQAMKDVHWTDGDLLDALRAVLEREGAITREILLSRSESFYEALRQHFGSFTLACERIGYRHNRNYELARERGVYRQELQHRLVLSLARKFSGALTIHKGRWSPRPHLRLGNTDISVQLCPHYLQCGKSHWLLTPRKQEKHFVTLCCMLAPGNQKFESMWLVPTLGSIKHNLKLHRGHQFFRKTLRLKGLNGFCANVRHVLQQRKFSAT